MTAWIVAGLGLAGAAIVLLTVTVWCLRIDLDRLIQKQSEYNTKLYRRVTALEDRGHG